MTERDDYWLDDEELTSFMSLMSVNIRLTNILDAQLRDDAGLSFFEYTVLSRLSAVSYTHLTLPTIYSV